MGLWFQAKVCFPIIGAYFTLFTVWIHLLVNVVLVDIPDDNCRLALNRHRLHRVHRLSSECCLYKEDWESTVL